MRGGGTMIFLSPPVAARDSHENGLLKRRPILAAFEVIEAAIDLSGDDVEAKGLVVGCDPCEEVLERETVEFLTLDTDWTD
jgi:hypothetical protein